MSHHSLLPSFLGVYTTTPLVPDSAVTVGRPPVSLSAFIPFPRDSRIIIGVSGLQLIHCFGPISLVLAKLNIASLWSPGGAQVPPHHHSCLVNMTFQLSYSRTQPSQPSLLGDHCPPVCPLARAVPSWRPCGCSSPLQLILWLQVSLLPIKDSSGGMKWIRLKPCCWLVRKRTWFFFWF